MFCRTCSLGKMLINTSSMRACKMAKHFLYTFFSLASVFGLLAMKKKFSEREIEKE